MMNGEGLLDVCKVKDNITSSANDKFNTASSYSDQFSCLAPLCITSNTIIHAHGFVWPECRGGSFMIEVVTDHPHLWRILFYIYWMVFV